MDLKLFKFLHPGYPEEYYPILYGYYLRHGSPGYKIFMPEPRRKPQPKPSRILDIANQKDMDKFFINCYLKYGTDSLEIIASTIVREINDILNLKDGK